MYRDRFGNNDFAAPDELIGHSYPNQPVPELDAKDERLLWLADKNGYLTGRNSVLENELYKKDQTIDRMDKTIKNLEEEVKRKNELYNEMYQDRDDWRTKARDLETELKAKVAKNVQRRPRSKNK